MSIIPHLNIITSSVSFHYKKIFFAKRLCENNRMTIFDEDPFESNS